jgi:hypothetical protein
MLPYEEKPDRDGDAQSSERTDFHSLLHTPDPDLDPGLLSTARSAPTRAMAPTDFRSLVGAKYGKVAPMPPRTLTDWIVEGLVPFLIFVMVYAVIFFLLDVRYVYTEVSDGNLRFVALCFVLGVVALNRLIARDGTDESMLYMAGLAGAIGMYTFATTGAYGVGSVAHNFMNDNPYLAVAFNMVIVAFLWWLTNRLMHECCIDENRSAGDVGILTGTARQFRSAVVREPEKKPARKDATEMDAFFYGIQAFDPLEGYQPNAAAPTKPQAGFSDRLAKRHPGISIFYFSAPVMLIFAFGLRVVRRGGDPMVRAGEFYMGVYTVCALMLLLLTSLGGLREYFRARRVVMPSAIGVFWLGLGVVMIAVVLVAATQLPKPALPPLAYVAEHQYDPWNRGSTFELSAISATPVELLEQSRFMDRTGKVVLAVLLLFLAYGALRGLLAVVMAVARHRERYPRFIVWLCNALEKLLTRLTQVPHLPKRRPRVRVQRAIATCTTYRNSLGDTAKTKTMKPADHVEYAYQALCALAYDLGVPRGLGETPYEFIAALPDALANIRPEAEDLTRLYVVSAYSPEEIGENTFDRVRRFWVAYNRVRNRVLR